jgi:POT family proton-dependent oligopeptide transporter
MQETPTPRPPRHPKGLYVLFFTEMWERFGFYTLMALFTLYLDEYFHFEDKGPIYGGFIALVYFAPIAGGLAADRLLGFRRTIMAGAVLLAAGYALLAVPYPENPASEARVAAAESVHRAERDAWMERAREAKARGQAFPEEGPKYRGPGRTDGRWLFFLALGVLVAGNGLFKPNISVMVGNLYEEGSPLKDSAFNIFYMGINIGAFTSPLAASWLRNSIGWGAAFGAAAAGMVVSLLTFLTFRRHLAPADARAGPGGAAASAEPAPGEVRGRILALLTVFAIVILFWMSFYQNGFTLTLWARDNTGPLLGDTFISPEVFQSVNPFFIVIFTPPLVALWGWLRRRGREPSTPAKMMIGMVLTAATFGTMALAGMAGGDTGVVSPFWLIGAYWLITGAELCLSPMGLSFVSKVAPRKIRGLMMGGWFGATAIGGYLSGAIEPLWKQLSHSGFFALLVVLSLFAALLLGLALRFLRRATA